MNTAELSEHDQRIVDQLKQNGTYDKVMQYAVIAKQCEGTLLGTLADTACNELIIRAEVETFGPPPEAPKYEWHRGVRVRVNK